MATHSSILVRKISWTEEPGGLQSPWVWKESDTTEVTEHAYMHCDLVVDFTNQIIL